MPDPLLKYYFLDIATSGPASDIGLNDVPIQTDGLGNGVRTILPVNEWIMPGANNLSVHLTWPEGKPHAPGAAEVKVSLFEADPQFEIPEPLVVHGEATWPLPPTPELYPHRLSVPLKIESFPPTRLWTEAEKIEKIDDESRVEILGLVEQLRAALMARNAEAALKLLAYRYDDEARAYGVKPEELRANVAKQYEIMWSEAQNKSDPLDPEAVALVVCAARKLVKVVAPNFKEAVVIRTEEAEYEIPVYVARVAGRWLIAR